jgi:hypothetical protein
MDVAERLISAGVVLVPHPKGVLIELNAFSLRVAEDSAPEPAVSQRVDSLLPLRKSVLMTCDFGSKDEGFVRPQDVISAHKILSRVASSGWVFDAELFPTP